MIVSADYNANLLQYFSTTALNFYDVHTPQKTGYPVLRCCRMQLKTHYRIKKTLFTLKISYAFFSFTSSNPLWPLYVQTIALYTQLLYLHQLNVTPYNNGASCFTPPFTEKSASL
jgi:hypothetical protein